MAADGALDRDNWDLINIVKLVGAILLVQALFWGVLNPVFIQPDVPPVEFIEVKQLSVATLSTPDAAGLAQADFRTTQVEPSVHFPRGYHGLRTEIELPDVPASGLALFGQNSADNVSFFVNGQILFGEGEMRLPKVSYHALTKQIVRIPPSMLKPGTNRIDAIRTFDIPRLGGNLPSLLGDYDAVSKAFGWKNFLLGTARIVSLVVGCVLALFILVALIRAEKKGFLLWLLLLTASWTLRSHFFIWADMPMHGFPRGLYYALLTLFLSACWPIFIDEWSQRPIRYFKPAILAIFTLAALAIGWWLLFVQGDTGWDKATDLLDQVGLLFMAIMLGRMLWHFLSSGDDRYWEAAFLITLGLLVAVFLYNIVIHGRNTPYLTLTQPLFLLAFSIAFFSRNFRLFQSSAQINALLKTQLDQRTAELEQAHARETQLVRLEAHGQERQRIMRDMHDGLGSHLMSMLMMAKRGKAKNEDYAEGLQQVIDEMRLMIDSMDSVGESLKSALAIFRKRVMPRVTNAGFVFEWKMEQNCPLPNYGPRDVLQIFRVLQEAVTNSLKHSGGNQIDVTIAPNPDPKWALQITIADNGQGLTEPKGRGRGLSNMAARAESIGAKVDVTNDKHGTLVTLDLPEKSTRTS